jgi:hypothetical protein
MLSARRFCPIWNSRCASLNLATSCSNAKLAPARAFISPSITWLATIIQWSKKPPTQVTHNHPTHSKADGALFWTRLRTAFAVPANSSIEWPVRGYQQRDGQLQPLPFTPTGHIIPIVAGDKASSLLWHP